MCVISTSKVVTKPQTTLLCEQSARIAVLVLIFIVVYVPYLVADCLDFPFSVFFHYLQMPQRLQVGVLSTYPIPRTFTWPYLPLPMSHLSHFLFIALILRLLIHVPLISTNPNLPKSIPHVVLVPPPPFPQTKFTFQLPHPIYAYHLPTPSTCLYPH